MGSGTSRLAQDMMRSSHKKHVPRTLFWCCQVSKRLWSPATQSFCCSHVSMVYKQHAYDRSGLAPSRLFGAKAERWVMFAGDPRVCSALKLVLGEECSFVANSLVGEATWGIWRKLAVSRCSRDARRFLPTIVCHHLKLFFFGGRDWQNFFLALPGFLGDRYAPDFVAR